MGITGLKNIIDLVSYHCRNGRLWIREENWKWGAPGSKPRSAV